MKKKFLSGLMALAIAIPCAFGLVGCGEDPADPTTPPATPTHTHSYTSYEYKVEDGKAYKVETGCSCEVDTKTELQNYVIATTDNVNEVIADATDGLTIVLDAGDYGVINMHNTLEDVTIIGTTATVEKIDIAGHTNANITIDNITFDGTAEWSGVYVGSIGLDGLTVRNCSFVKNSYILGGGSQPDHISIMNLLVEGCSFDMTDMENKDSVKLSAINIWGSDGVTIKNNTFKNVDYNAIQLAGEINGAVLIEGNDIDGTADRALRFNNVNETITIRNNTIKGVQEEDGELLKATSVTAEGSLVFENNTYDGNAWAPENVTTESTNVIYTITLA
ncbi:MAG: right-handed parallel beta-helix repeat-containing protein [Clostridiales bacterium]|nr:right-handed parallel beta-helix repeat-containing protein [Clostridiales bacterium]